MAENSTIWFLRWPIIMNVITFILTFGIYFQVTYSFWGTDTLYYIGSQFGEVCHAPSINYDPLKMRDSIEQHVFGQPFVNKLMLPLLDLHLKSTDSNRKSLVLSFHGTPGSGKNHVSRLIAEAMFEKGMESKYVHLFKPILHFSNGPPEILKLNLQSWIKGNITNCNRQLFIFDEVNDMPDGILEAVQGFIDYSPLFGGLDHSKCVFIFLSNLGMKPINNRALELWRSGKKLRNELEYQDFRDIIIKHSFNEDGGFKKCKLISNRVIDAFIPFLPLERSHVKKCILRIAAEYVNVPMSSTSLDKILTTVEFGPDELDLYSVHGCKNLETPIKMELIKASYTFKDEM